MGIFNPDNKCVCGHIYYDHVRYDGFTCTCSNTLLPNGDWCECSNFKLDNLWYVEHLAKQKGLM